MSAPLRTAYHAATSSVDSFSSSSSDSTYSDASTRQTSSAPSTPHALHADGDEDGDNTAWNRPGALLKESLYEIEEEADASAEGARLDGDGASIASVETYASTALSEILQQETLPEEEYTIMPSQNRSRPGLISSCGTHQCSYSSSPDDFAYYFPSTRMLHVSHPDDCVDGNMNLTVQTEGWAAAAGDTSANDAPVPVPLVLYYFRMRNLKKREFCLRRYCRDSGREVCHTTRRYTRPATAREGKTGWQQRIENALSTLWPSPPAKKRKDSTSSSPSLGRLDSGYASMVSRNGLAGLKVETDVEEATSPISPSSANAVPSGSDERRDSATRSVLPKATNLPLPTNTTKLEFSNYMHLDLRRRGGRGRGIKRYDFEHWGVQYSWHRRIVQKLDGHRPSSSNGVAAESVEFHLHATDTRQPASASPSSPSRSLSSSSSSSSSRTTVVAHIVPESLTAGEQAAEDGAGGWVPRSSLWISDQAAIGGPNGAEVADVIVATGLLALVDDAIKRRWDTKRRLMDRFARSLPVRKRAASAAVEGRTGAKEAGRVGLATTGT